MIEPIPVIYNNHDYRNGAIKSLKSVLYKKDGLDELHGLLIDKERSLELELKELFAEMFRETNND